MTTNTSTRDIVGPEETKFFTKQWLPPTGQPTIASLLFVHGFVEHIQRYDHVFPKYAERGIAVFAYDQRGFGQTAFYTAKHSQGVTSWAQQFTDLDFFVQHVKQQSPNGTPYFLMGHSMGGGEVLGYSTRNPLSPTFTSSNFRGIIASSPLLRQAKSVKAPSFVVKLGSIVGKLSSTLPINAKVKPQDTCRDPDVQKAYAEDRLCKQVGTFRGVADMLLGGESVVSKDWKNWPVAKNERLSLLVVHGEADKVTDHEASKEFVERVQSLGVKDATYKGFEGFYHEMHNEPGNDKWIEIDYIVDWIVQRSQPTPASTSSQQQQTPSSLSNIPKVDTATTITTGNEGVGGGGNAPTIQVSPASPIVEGGGGDGGLEGDNIVSSSRDSKL